LHDGATPDAAPDGTTIAKFVLRVLAWSVVLFPSWFFASSWIARPVAAGAAIVAQSVDAVDSARVAFSADGPAFVLKPSVATILARGLPPGTNAEVPLDTRKHTCGLPFFLALLLASARRATWNVAAGSAIVLAFAALGLGCELLLQAGSTMGPRGAPLFPMAGATKEAIAVGYQLGVLIFPTVIPLLLWGIFTRGALARA